MEVDYSKSLNPVFIEEKLTFENADFLKEDKKFLLTMPKVAEFFVKASNGELKYLHVLGEIFEKGNEEKNISVDICEAYRWYDLGASRLLKSAITGKTRIIIELENTTKLKLLELSKNSEDFLLKMGEVYELGSHAVKRNLSIALKWYIQADDKNSEKGREGRYRVCNLIALEYERTKNYFSALRYYLEILNYDSFYIFKISRCVEKIAEILKDDISWNKAYDFCKKEKERCFGKDCKDLIIETTLEDDLCSIGIDFEEKKSNIDLAKIYYLQSSELKNINASRRLGRLLFLSDNLDDQQKGEELIELAASKGHKGAQNLINVLKREKVKK